MRVTLRPSYVTQRSEVAAAGIGPGGAGTSPVWRRELDEYQQLFFNLHLHLRGEIGTREEAEELAELAATEFHRDAQGKPDLHKEQFRQAIFQLTDLWTDTVSQVRCRLYCITAVIL